ncbi:MAG: hypothetical protein PWQ17_575 [Anaerophaga sp.]|nr:hypothetical protein [Anaerophaga sp.]MDN5291596.1 hypothetical protein [Anaerophaga sp.]
MKQAWHFDFPVGSAVLFTKKTATKGHVLVNEDAKI